MQPSGTEQERIVVDSTYEFASRLSVKVVPVLTDDAYMTTCADGSPCQAAGWYVSGKAYYYRPWLITQSVDYARAVAAHEVCHAMSMNHDKKHDDCIRSLGE